MASASNLAQLTVGLPNTDLARTGTPPQLAAARRLILFAFADSRFPTASLERACLLARRLDSDLHVLSVVSPSDRVRGSISTPGGGELEATRAWVRVTLGTGIAESNVGVQAGDFVERTAVHARRVGAALIVTPPGRGRAGTTVTMLAERSYLPVLVARASRSHGAVIAGTDLQDQEFRVLRKAAELAERLDAQVVVVHNLAQLELVTGRGAAGP